MNLLSVEQLSKSFGEKTLFENISFGIAKGQKVALVARNGTGKTTLINILAGLDTPDNGNVTYRKDLTLGYLPQEPEINPALTVLEVLFTTKSPVIEAIQAYERALAIQEEQGYSPKNQAELEAATQVMDATQAWSYEAKVKEILFRLQIKKLDQKIGTLSGGQKKRVSLASMLINQPELIMMDEPTNHLDLEMISWLEAYLSQQNLSLLLVTHDRYFLDRVCNLILELDAGNLYTYHGNYGYFLEKKAERQFNEARELEKVKNKLRRELEWMRRQPKARTTKSKSREDSFYELQEAAQKRPDEKTITLAMKMTRIGGKIGEFKNVSMRLGDVQILKNFSYVFKPGDRIGIVGKNGVGKTTFLNLLTQQIQPDAGTVILGESIVLGYYKQDGIDFLENQRVIERVKQMAEVIELQDGTKLTASQFLQLFLFDPPQQHSVIAKLSGGERRRLQLLTILVKNPNFLILDEPTNDLDLLTLDRLEEFLLNFPGVLVIVSHDRYFLDKLVNHLFILDGSGQVTDYNGSYLDYYAETLEKEKALKAISFDKKTSPTTAVEQNLSNKKLSYNELKEYQKLEKEIEKFEARKSEITELMSSGADHFKLQAWAKEIEAIDLELEAKTARWYELAERL